MDEEVNPEEKRGNSFLGWLREIALVIVAALILSFLIKLFLMRAFYIPSQSMMNTLDVNDRILVSELTPRFFDLERGDIVVFNDPGGWLSAADKPQHEWWRTALMYVGLYPQNAGEQVVKRVIGMPGDRVKCCSPQGRIVVNGTPIKETYLPPGMAPSQRKFNVKVPAGHLWVMGDNRSNSADSRFPGHGAIPEDDVVGKVFLINWPLDRIRIVHTPSAVFKGVPNP